MKKAFLFLTLAASLSINQLAAQSNAVDTAAKTQTTGDEKIFEKVDVPPSVDMRMWRRHVETQLLPYIIDAARANMKPGQYKVEVRFLVEADGRISDVKALNDPGYGLAKGAEKVIKTGPKWTGAELNGRKVRAYHIQPVVFYIMDKKPFQ